jgi:hypothetical protein
LALALSVVIVPVGAIWTMSGLAECDRANCDPIAQFLYDTSGLGLIVTGLAFVAVPIALIGLIVSVARRRGG